MRKGYLLLAGIAAAGIVMAWAMGGAAADPAETCRNPAIAAQLADSASGDQLLACCFEGSTDQRCDFSSPNQTGCEWKLAYQCPDGNYTCDADTKVCICDKPVAATSP